MNEREKLSEKVARSALEGFFGSEGFGDMSRGQRKKAMQKVLKTLEKEFSGGGDQVKE